MHSGNVRVEYLIFLKMETKLSLNNSANLLFDIDLPVQKKSRTMFYLAAKGYIFNTPKQSLALSRLKSYLNCQQQKAFNASFLNKQCNPHRSKMSKIHYFTLFKHMLIQRKQSNIIFVKKQSPVTLDTKLHQSSEKYLYHFIRTVKKEIYMTMESHLYFIAVRKKHTCLR